MSFGSALQRLREQAGLSQSQLALKASVPIDSLRNWEQGRVLPRIDAVIRLARALGVTVDELVADVAAPAEPSPPPAEQAGTGKGRKRSRKKGE
jgi:transcriptional regulator with XRE-family HTH domain